MQCPRDRFMQDSASRKFFMSILPARTASDICQTPVPEPILCPLKQPLSIGPPETTRVGKLQLAAPIINEGVVLSHPQRSTTPSIGLPRIVSSASMEARLWNSIAVGRRFDSPNDMTGNSTGKAPSS